MTAFADTGGVRETEKVRKLEEIRDIEEVRELEEVRETEGDAGITFISDGQKLEPERPRPSGEPGPGGGGPDGKWVILPQTGSASHSASQSAGATLLVGAMFTLVIFARREGE